METKKKRQIIFGSIVLLLSFVLLWYILREKTYCGTVTDKISALEYNKNVSRPDPILIVRFDINKKRKEIHTTWITYRDNNVNDRVCFSEKIIEMEPIWINSGLLLLISAVLLATGVVVFMDVIGLFDPISHDY